MDTPFKVLFCQPEYEPTTGLTMDKEILITNFVQDEIALYKMTDDEVPEVVENKRLTLSFSCDDEEARLYMDGLDIVPAKYLEGDSAPYLAPTEIPILLYDTPNKKDKLNPIHSDGYYPFIPGYYRIKVIIGGKSYFSWLKVKPKQITEEQWVSMRNDIEETLHGLAQDLIHKNASLGINSEIPIPLHILRKLYIIKKDFSKWVTALKDIQTNPRMRIRKEYNLSPRDKTGIIDAESIRYYARHPESRDYIYQPKNVRSYDLVENQWMQKIIKFIAKEMNELLEYLEKHKEKVNKEIKREKYFHHNEHAQVRLKSKVLDELTKYERFVKRVRSDCLLVLQEEWMTEVKETTPMSIPHSLNLDPRYRRLFSLYRVLKSEDVSISLDSSYDYYWKRTDLLYEIWGFLQLINGLQHESIGFEVVKGWIFDVNSNSKSVQVPFLEPGTTIEFKRGNTKLNLFYDETLPFKKEATTLKKPIFTNSNRNRPDARIDLYESEEYIGTIMFDFKYRPLRFVWDSAKLKGSNKTDTMQQLISYRDNIYSPFLYRHEDEIHWQNLRPVHEVWAIYPSHEDNNSPKNPLDDYRVRLMELTPLGNQDLFYQSIEEAIQKVIDAY
ncbi:hypothetical protein AS52_02211 [Priestia megaterium Q3]|uniref:DUF2357 domain-containing protein n=1 Tax=Priestia megaterium Q3 TaxID=1452722 RepID=A0A806TZ95_PRIMG|nr:DUF2357 domain-containing protein [Priestia megaterium]AKP77176.1 hypothetical protein AS52_02211 [Priestia megaterium Q3]